MTAAPCLATGLTASTTSEHVESLNLEDRTLRIEFTVSSPSLYEGFARRLIADKILREVCVGAYLGRADTVAFTNLATGRVASVPYS